MTHLTVSLTAAGSHPAGWRLSPLPPLADIRALREMARTAERIGLDAILLGVPGSTPSDLLQFDPLPLLGALIAATGTIGLSASWSIDFSEPYHVARVFATLDHLAHGRTGWMPLLNTTARLRPCIGKPGSPDDRADYSQRVAEFVDVTRKLWDSWQDQAWAMDKASGMFVDPEKVAPIHHGGAYFKVRGPLNVPRPPQGNPVVLIADPAETALRRVVAENADVVLIRAASQAEAAARTAELRALAGHDIRVLADLLVILDDTTAEAQARAATLDAMATTDLPRFVGTPAQLAEMIAGWSGSCDGFNLLPAVLPYDLDGLAGLETQPPAGASLRDHFRLTRPLSQYEGMPA